MLCNSLSLIPERFPIFTLGCSFGARKAVLSRDLSNCGPKPERFPPSVQTSTHLTLPQSSSRTRLSFHLNDVFEVYLKISFILPHHLGKPLDFSGKNQGRRTARLGTGSWGKCDTLPPLGLVWWERRSAPFEVSRGLLRIAVIDPLREAGVNGWIQSLRQ